MQIIHKNEHNPNNQQSQPETRFSSRVAPRAQREIVIDLLRGLAVALMIVTHVIGLTYNGDNELVKNIGIVGGIASFTTFLFISGISGYLSYISLDNDRGQDISDRGSKILSNAFKILLVYYLLATASIFVNSSLYSFPPTTAWIEIFSKTIFLIIVPEYTEFIVALILFSVSLVLLRPFYKALVQNPLIGIFLMITIYALGRIIYIVDLNSVELNSIKALLAGHDEMHTFPLLMYFPVYMLGMYFGRFFHLFRDKFLRLRFFIISTIVFIAFAVQTKVAFDYLDINLFDPLPNSGRFPPSLGFLALSLAISITTLLVIHLTSKFIPKVFKAFIHYMGVNAFDMFLFHTMLLFIYKYITTTEALPDGRKHPNSIDVIVIYLVVIGLSMAISVLKNSIKEWSLEESDNVNDTWWIFTERAISSVIFVIIFAIVGSTLYRDVFVTTAKADPNEVQFKKRLVLEEEYPRWWDHKYAYYRQINIKNSSSFETLFKNNWVGIKFNHGELVSQFKALSSGGNDLRIAYFDDNLGEFKELPFIIKDVNSGDTKVEFKVVENIAPGESSDKYFLYYGNHSVTNYPKSVETPSNSVTYNNIDLKNEVTHSIDASVNKLWFLKKKATAFQSKSLIITAEIKSDEIAENSIVTYTIPGTDRFGKMNKLEGDKYQAAVAVSDLEPGIYTIQANVTESKDNLKIFRSKEVTFYVTYPIYVTWTMDWEGWDVDQSNLNELAAIADGYGAPMTHFFNPRIYVQNQYTITSISQNRSQYITKWVKDRQKNSYEEIGVHMHMWTDMVAETGVAPRSGPIIQGTYGVDVATSEYSQQELEQIFRWGRQKFADNDLGAPISYRTGAWMSGPNVLKAAQNVGFLIDSSGRTGGPINRNQASTNVPWNLNITTKPYLPNVNDINKWEGERMSIWEFPNNGADTYWFPRDELVSRFDQNYPNKGEVLYKPQVVTYLSHPHWFVSVDSWKTRSLFDYISQYTNKNDRGPVVFATLETIYSEWDRQTFINGD